MVEIAYDYECGTVGECIVKHCIPDNWCAEFDAHDGIFPIVCIQVSRIRKVPAMMGLKLRTVERPDEEYPGCVMLAGERTVVFKVDRMRDLAEAFSNGI